MANGLYEICVGVGDRLRTIPRLQVRDVVPNKFPVEYAVGLVYPRPGDQFARYHVVAGASARGGIHVWYLNIRIIVGRVNDIEAQKRLYEFFSTDTEYSIVNAIKADPTLDGRAAKTLIEGGYSFGEVTLSDGRAYQVGDLLINVTANPSITA